MTPRGLLFCASLLSVLAAAPAQQKATPASRTVQLDVTVASKSGSPVTGLKQQDFTLLDNKSPRAITSFKPVTTAQGQIEFILLIDAVNIPFSTSAYVRGELEKFFKANDGRLPHPTTLAVLTDTGAQIQSGFTTDGKLLRESLDKFKIGLRTINNSSGIEGAEERTQISLKAVHQLAGYASTLPGRKVIVWISPGWPLLSGIHLQLGEKQQRAIFRDVVDLSTQFREARITFDDINPLGASETVFDTYHYQEFLRGVAKPGETDIADVSLQVLSLQNGGLALENSTDVTNQLQRCFDDASSWYQLSFEASPAERPDEYHHIELKLTDPDLTVRTRDGYYAQP